MEGNLEGECVLVRLPRRDSPILTLLAPFLVLHSVHAVRAHGLTGDWRQKTAVRSQRLLRDAELLLRRPGAAAYVQCIPIRVTPADKHHDRAVSHWPVPSARPC